MLNETAFEILRFFSRVELEGLQMHSRFLRDFVDRNVDQLPLLSIYKISTSPQLGGGVHVFLEKDNEDTHFGVQELTDANLGLLFDRLKNAFVERLETDFSRSDDIRFLRHLRDHGAELQCRITLLDVQPTYGLGFIAYVLVNTVAERLRPQTLWAQVIDAQRTPEATLFDHGSLRRVLKHVHFNIGRNTLRASHLIPGLLNVDGLQTCGISPYEDATPWIVRFAEMFKRANGGDKMIRSVAVVHSRGGDEPAPVADSSSPLGKPQRTDVPVPRGDFAEIIPSRPPTAEKDFTESAAELFVFTNLQLDKRLDVYKWSGVQTVDFAYRRLTRQFSTTYRYDFYLLKIVDI